MAERTLTPLEALEQVVWKLNRNDEHGPAKIDRNDAVIREAVRAIEAAKDDGRKLTHDLTHDLGSPVPGCVHCEQATEDFERRKVRYLTCCVCGAPARGRQWWNRDTGFGVCAKCVDWLKARGASPEEMHSLYGVEGIHYNVASD